ncbi:MAG: PAS domain-containing protein, partial [Cyanobacteria bacterium J06559_3]
MLGYGEDEIGNCRSEWDSRIHPQDKPDCYVDLERHFNGEVPVYQNEHRLRCKAGDYKWILTRGKVIEWTIDGKPLRVIGTHTDISDRKRAETALIQSEAKSRAMLAAMPDLVLRIGADGIFRESVSNKPEISLVPLGSVPDMVGSPMADLVPADVVARHRHYIEQALRTGELQVYEQQVQIGDRMQDEEVRMVKSGDDEVLLIIRDISERKRIEAERNRARAAIEESEQRFRSLFESTPNIAVQGYDRHRRVIYWNDASEHLYGYSQAEATGQQLEDLIFPPAVRSWAIGAVQAWLAGGPPVPAGELTLQRKDGSSVAVFSSHVMLKNPAGEPEMYCVDVDLSERKQAEEALRESEARWQFALEGAGDGVWDWNIQTHKVFYSQPLKAMLGYDETDIGNRLEEWESRIHPEDKPHVHDDLHRCLRGESTVYQNEHRLRCKSGNYKWTLDRGKVIERDADGQPLRMIGIQTDISDRKQAEAQLQSLIEGTAATTGQDFFPALVEHISATLNVTCALVSELIDDQLHTLAFSIDGVLQPKTIYQHTLTPCRRTLQDGHFYCECSVQQQFPESLALVEMGAQSYLGVSLRNLQGQTIGTLCILDTEPIQAPQRAKQILRVFAARAAAELERQRASTQLEQLNQNLEAKVAARTVELQASEAQIRAMISAIPDLLLRVRPDGTCLEYIVSHNQVGTFLPIERHISEVLPSILLEQQLDKITQAIATDTLQVYEHRVEKRGHLVYEEVRIGKLSSEEALIIVRDITDRKQTEAALQQVSERLNLAVESAGIGIWDWDIANNSLIWDAQMYYLYGFTKDQFANIYEAWINSLHPDDRATAELVSQQARSGNRPYDTEFRIIRPDGTTRFIKANAIVQRNSRGEAQRMIGINYDFTDRKQAQLALQAKTEELDRFFSLALDLLCIANTDGYFLRLNHQWEKTLGYDLSTLEGSRFLDYLLPDDLDKTLEAIAQLEAGQAILNFTNR